MNEAITTSNIPEAQSYRRIGHSKFYTIPSRWHEVLRWHLKGFKDEDIAKTTGYALNTVWYILDSPLVQALKEAHLNHTYDEFESLFQKVVDNLRSQLDSDDSRVQQIAQTQWFKVSKRFQKMGEKEELTAEDIVSKLLQVNVQVNVDAK